jgi:hypothetical protein
VLPRNAQFTGILGDRAFEPAGQNFVIECKCPCVHE